MKPGNMLREGYAVHHPDFGYRISDKGLEFLERKGYEAQSEHRESRSCSMRGVKLDMRERLDFDLRRPRPMKFLQRFRSRLEARHSRGKIPSEAETARPQDMPTLPWASLAVEKIGMHGIRRIDQVGC